MEGGEQCHTKRRGGREGPHRPRGESNANQKERREQQRHPKERGGKAATSKKEEEWEACSVQVDFVVTAFALLRCFLFRRSLDLLSLVADCLVIAVHVELSDGS